MGAPTLRALRVVLIVVLGASFAGCTSSPEPEVLLRQSDVVGTDLYSWGDPAFTNPGAAGGRETIRASFDVGPGIGRLGVSFIGTLKWAENSTAIFTIRDEDGGPVIRLNATNGAEDDEGTIDSFWSFRRTVLTRPGTYDIEVVGRGNIGHLEFSVHGIPEGATSIDHPFNVTEADRPLRVTVYTLGWGVAPEVAIVAPDGTRTPVIVDAPNGQGHLDLDPKETGAYRFEADTADWGGRLMVEIIQG